MSAEVYWIWLATRANLGAARIKPLVEYFLSAENIYKCGYKDFQDIRGINPNIAEQLLDKDLSFAEKAILNCHNNNYSIITIADEKYPQRLKNIYDPPVVLYIDGNLPDVDNLPVVGIVGTRRCTPYGVKNAEAAGYKLSLNGFTVVTGLAEGIDTAATRGALRGSTPTVGVIGCGIDKVFPASNREIYKDVASKGAVVSEYPPGTPAVPGHFPSRNRIISGLSNGVAVIEAPERSGALITAQRALEEGRDVFVLPGNVDAATCVGSNKLLRDGAIPFMSADDIIDEYKDSYKVIKKPFDNNVTVDYIDLDKLTEKLDDKSKLIMKSIGNNPVDVDDIIANTSIDAQNVLSVLTMLELDGYLRRNLIGKWEIIN